jgi:hypothetical protein
MRAIRAAVSDPAVSDPGGSIPVSATPEDVVLTLRW